MFFPSSGRVSNKAKSFCNNCPVLKECLEQALKNDDDGIRAGTTYRERLSMQRFHRGLSGTASKTRTNIVFS